MSDALRQFLADRDVPCPSCRYNLRGAPGPDCPECGKPIPWPWPKRQRQQMKELDWAFITGLVWSLICAVIWAAAIVVTANDPLWLIAMWVPAFLVLLTGLLGFVWLVTREPMRPRGEPESIFFVLASWGLGSVFLVILVLILLLMA